MAGFTAPPVTAAGFYDENEQAAGRDEKNENNRTKTSILSDHVLHKPSKKPAAPPPLWHVAQLEVEKLTTESTNPLKTR